MLLIGFWAILGQLYFVLELQATESLASFLIISGRPLRTLYIISLLIVFPSIVLPIFFIDRSDKFKKLILEILDRLSLLSILYIALDLLGIVIVVIRNI